MEIPTDVTAEDLQAASIPLEPDEVIAPRRKGRQPYPRDADGNIIYPPGHKRHGQGSGKNPYTPANRQARIDKYRVAIQGANWYVVDGMCIVCQIPPIMAKNPVEHSLTPIGQMLSMDQALVDMYAVTYAHAQETEVGLKVSQAIDKFTPYGYIIVSAGMTVFWVAAIVKARKQIQEAAQQMATVMQMRAQAEAEAQGEAMAL